MAATVVSVRHKGRARHAQINAWIHMFFVPTRKLENKIKTDRKNNRV
jgi:hypothetical protein